MDFGKGFKRALGILKLDAGSVKETSRDSGATGMAFIFALIGGAVGGLLGGPAGIIGGAVFAVIGLAIWTAILWVLAMLFGGKAGYTDLLRPLGHSALLSVVGIIPFIGQIVMLWLVVVDIVVVKNVYNFSTGKAAAVVLIPVVILAIIALILVVIAGALLATMGLGSLGILSMMGK